MGWYVVRRLLGAIPLLLVTSFIVFSFLHLAPGSPEQVLLAGKNVDPETLQAIRDEYHLDDPFLVQYWHWLTNVVERRPRRVDRLPRHGRERRRPADRADPRARRLRAPADSRSSGSRWGSCRGSGATARSTRRSPAVTLVGSSISTYVSGILLIAVFSVALGWFPVFGLGGSGLDRIYHLTLPAIALAIALSALVGRTARASVGNAMEQEFVETARSRGFTERRVIGKHALRNALIPVITISGLVFGFLISGAVLVEYTFGLNGLGALLIQAVRTKDFAVVQAITLLLTFAFILINLAVDLLYVAIDPACASSGAEPDGSGGARSALDRRRFIPRVGAPAAAVVAGAVIVLLVLVAIFAPLLAPYDPNAGRPVEHPRAAELVAIRSAPTPPAATSSRG